MMENITVEGGSLDDLIAETMKASEAAVRAASKDAAKKAANDTAKRLKSTSPKRKGGYAKGWKVTFRDGGYIVHNSRFPGFTQLLEKGHDVVVNGKKVGRAKAEPHIAPAEQAGVEDFRYRIYEEVNRRLSEI